MLPAATAPLRPGDRPVRATRPREGIVPHARRRRGTARPRGASGRWPCPTRRGAGRPPPRRPGRPRVRRPPPASPARDAGRAPRHRHRPRRGPRAPRRPRPRSTPPSDRSRRAGGRTGSGRAPTPVRPGPRVRGWPPRRRESWTGPRRRRRASASPRAPPSAGWSASRAAGRRGAGTAARRRSSRGRDGRAACATSIANRGLPSLAAARPGSADRSTAVPVAWRTTAPSSSGRMAPSTRSTRASGRVGSQSSTLRPTGRVAATTRIGRSVDRRSAWPRAWVVAPSSQCASSMTSASGCCRARLPSTVRKATATARGSMSPGDSSSSRAARRAVRCGAGSWSCTSSSQVASRSASAQKPRDSVQLRRSGVQDPHVPVPRPREQGRQHAGLPHAGSRGQDGVRRAVAAHGVQQHRQLVPPADQELTSHPASVAPSRGGEHRHFRPP